VALIADIVDQAGTCIVFGSDSVTFDGGMDGGLVIDGDGDGEGMGIDVKSHSGVTVSNSLVTRFALGVMGAPAGQAIVTECEFDHNTDTGIGLVGGSRHVVSDNTCAFNLVDGIALVNTDSCVVVRNEVQANFHWGVIAYNMQASTISHNVIRWNGNETEEYGIILLNCDNNFIYRNNIISNQNQAYDDGTNDWDNGYISGGNYWDDYNEPAEGCLDSDSDGRCDDPYVVWGSNQDRYPFVSESGWVVSVPEVRGFDGVLLTNKPNPFSDRTAIRFGLPRRAQVVLRVFGVSGRRVRTLIDKVMGAGSWGAIWDGRDDDGQLVAAGIYFCRLEANEFVATTKMTVLR
jgi:parallel beta-helix repeat protein